MSIQNAMSLLNTIDEDAKLRDRIFFCINSKKLMIFLSSQGYHFTVDELEEAIRHQHLKCQTLEAAQRLLHKAEWLRFLIYSNVNSERE